MEQKIILGKILEVLGTLGKDEEITPETSLMDDLGLESLQIFELLAGVEAAFAIRIPERVLMRIDTVQDMVDEIEKIVGV